MPTVKTNNIELCYDTFGDPKDPAMLLLMGLGCQMVLWSESFCQQLAERGYHVIRFDHRDIGQSTKLPHLGVPSRLELLRAQLRMPVSIPYTLKDMAIDTLGLLDALQLQRAHWVGASMGGMIAQHAAIMAPERFSSMCLWMTSSHRSPMPPPKLRVMKNLLRRHPNDREGGIELGISRLRSLSGGVLPFDEDLTRGLVTEAWDRGSDPAGFVRQLAAVVSAPSRVEELSKVQIPTLVMHGRLDPMIPVSHAYDLAKIIPRSRLTIFEDIGHDYPTAAWPKLIQAIHQHAKQS